MIYRLIILNGERRGHHITVPREPLTIGRGSDCLLRINDPEMGLTHACVEHRATGLLIRDLGTMHKILVNNNEVTQARLRHGDVVELGRTRFLVQAFVQAEVQTPPEVLARRRRWRVAAALLVGTVAASVAFAVWRGRRSEGDASPDRTSTEAWPAAPTETASPSGEAVELAHATPPGEGDAPQPAPVEAGGPETPWIPEEPPLPPSLAEATDPAEVPGIAPTPSPSVTAEDLLLRKAEDMLAEARAHISNHALEAADEMLLSVERMVPNYLPAYAERAALFTRRGMLEPALRQWEEVLRRGPASPLAAEARLRRQELLAARERLIPEYAGRIKIAAAEQNRFPATSDFGEVRSISVTLRPAPTLDPINPAAVRIELRFFEREPGSGRIRPSPIGWPASGLTLSDTWPKGEDKTVTATYQRPAARDREGHQPPQFYGYVVRVYYYGALQDVYAQPARLLQQLSDPAAALAPPGGDESRVSDPVATQS